MKQKRMKFGLIKVGNDRIYIDKHKPLHFFVFEPFRQQRLNFYYLKLCYALEKDKNRLVFETISHEVVPYHKEALVNYLNVSRQYFDIIFRRLCHNDIIMQVKIFNIMEYYINPRFVWCGNGSIPKFLLDMFRYDAEGIYGEHIFDINNTIYEKDKKNENNTS
jgi:hypothetical protein